MASRLEAQPQSLEIDWNRTAVIIIDMQNAFISQGGMFDLRESISPDWPALSVL